MPVLLIAVELRFKKMPAFFALGNADLDLRIKVKIRVLDFYSLFFFLN